MRKRVRPRESKAMQKLREQYPRATNDALVSGLDLTTIDETIMREVEERLMLEASHLRPRRGF